MITTCPASIGPVTKCIEDTILLDEQEHSILAFCIVNLCIGVVWS